MRDGRPKVKGQKIDLGPRQHIRSALQAVLCISTHHTAPDPARPRSIAQVHAPLSLIIARLIGTTALEQSTFPTRKAPLKRAPSPKNYPPKSRQRMGVKAVD